MEMQIVVSSENTPYLAWQTQLFCASAISRVGQPPLVIVHQASEEPLLAEFQMLNQHGCRIIAAPSYRKHPKGNYPPRNEIGSLLTLASLDVGSSHILFCEADMLFVRPPTCVPGLTGEHYTYLHYKEERIRRVATIFGLGNEIGRLNEAYAIGVPYLLPTSKLYVVARRWLEVLDAFQCLEWIDIMYAFGMTLALENLECEITHMMHTNEYQDDIVTRDIIHYGYGDSTWSKRAYRNVSPLQLPDHGLAHGRTGSILAEIMMQIREARTRFHLNRQRRNRWLHGVFNAGVSELRPRMTVQANSHAE